MKGIEEKKNKKRFKSVQSINSIDKTVKVYDKWTFSYLFVYACGFCVFFSFVLSFSFILTPIYLFFFIVWFYWWTIVSILRRFMTFYAFPPISDFNQILLPPTQLGRNTLRTILYILDSIYIQLCSIYTKHITHRYIINILLII